MLLLLNFRVCRKQNIKFTAFKTQSKAARLLRSLLNPVYLINLRILNLARLPNFISSVVSIHRIKYIVSLAQGKLIKFI